MSDDTFDGEDGFKNLRKAYDKQKADLAALQQSLEAIQAEKRGSQLAELFKAKGLSEAAAKHYTGDPSEDAVVAWATDLGLISAQSAPDSKTDPNAEAAARVAGATSGRDELGNGVDSDSGKPVGDPFERLNALQSMGYDDLVKAGYIPAHDPSAI